LPDLAEVHEWDGKSMVNAFDVLVTTRTPAEIERQITAAADAFPPQGSLFELPPVFMDAAMVLAKLQQTAAAHAEEQP
jgi:hypothetical protein